MKLVRPSVCLSVPPCGWCRPLLRVGCCGPGGQQTEISIDCCTAGGQCHVSSVRRLAEHKLVVFSRVRFTSQTYRRLSLQLLYLAFRELYRRDEKRYKIVSFQITKLNARKSARVVVKSIFVS